MNMSITKEALEELYINENKTRIEIAKIFNISVDKVSDFCKKYNIRKIKIRQKANCLNCNRVFTMENDNHRFCCRKCRTEYMAKQKDVVYIKICKNCGKEYEYYDNMSNWFLDGQINGTKYHGVDSSKYCCYECGINHRQNVSRKTCLDKYGVEYTFQSENNLEKSKQTKLEKYGNEYYTNAEKIQKSLKNKTDIEKLMILNKVKQTKLKRYGYEFFDKNKKYSEEEMALINAKRYNTFVKNNSFNGKGRILNHRCSLDEQKIYEILISKFTVDFEPFIKGYGKSDFYIHELDLYIEYQGTWTHGKDSHRIVGSYLENKKDCIDLLEKWQEKAKTSRFYEKAIEVWTKRDPLKRKIAKELGLNLIEFFTMKDFMSWFEKL